LQLCACAFRTIFSGAAGRTFSQRRQILQNGCRPEIAKQCEPESGNRGNRTRSGGKKNNKIYL